MRLAFWILVVLNLVLLAGAQGLFGGGEGGREPDRLARQLKPEQLRIVAAADAAPAVPPPAEPAPAAPPPPPPVELACKRIEGLAPAEAESLTKALADLPDWQTRVIALDVPPSYWVAIPGLSSRTTAEKKRDEVDLLGIKDHEILESTPLGPFAVSFGRLTDETAAKELLQGLQKKGVRSARVVSPPVPERKAVELRAPAAVLDQKLPELAALFATASIGDCSVP